MIKPLRSDLTGNPEEHLDPDWGYVWQDPASPKIIPHGDAIWRSPRTDSVAHLTERLIKGEHRAKDLRGQITALNITPKGRTRAQLAQQLARAFLDPDRLAASLDGLTETLRQQYTRLLLHSYFDDYYTRPASKGLWTRDAKYSSQMVAQLRRADLVLDDIEGQAYVPFFIRRELPQLSIPLPPAAEPGNFTPAANPQTILGQIQQLLYILQAETMNLRPVLRWQPPQYAYARTPPCWPVALEDAKALQRGFETNRLIQLLSPPQQPDDIALEACAGALGVSSHRIALLYRLLVTGGMVLEGSPVTVETESAQAWFSEPPAKQASDVYQLYSATHGWAAWWPRWRDGTITVAHTYQGYWSLASLETRLQETAKTLRLVVLEALSFLPDRTWIATKDLVRWLQRLFPTVETHRYLTGLLPEHRDSGWPGFLETAVTSMLAGPLHAMGLVDIGPSLEEMHVIRLRGLKDLHWGRVTEVEVGRHEQPLAARIRYDATEHSLEVETPAPPAFMAFVLRWAKPAGFSQSRIRYALSTDQLYIAFENGADPQSLASDWQRCVGTDPVPEIIAWWQAWWCRYGRVRIYSPQAMLQTRDALTMQEVRLALPSIEGAVVGVLTPETTLLKPEAVDQLLDDLSRQGYMPKEVT